MVFTWIAVVIVLSLMIGFVTLSIIWTAKSVGDNIRTRSTELLSAYDELLEKRSRELSALDVELENRDREIVKISEEDEKPVEVKESPAIDTSSFLKTAEQLSMTPYQDSGAGEAYQRIRQTFAAVSDDTVRQLLAQPEEKEEGSATVLLKMLSFDTIYQLSTLPGTEQLQILMDTIPASDAGFLQQYAASNQVFDSIAFYDSLKSAAASENRSVRLCVAPQDAKLYPATLDVTVDEDICEGFQVEKDNILYDFAIRAREIG